MIRALLFDMDGLIVDTEPIHFMAFRGMMREYGVEIDDSLMPGFVGFPEAEHVDPELERCGWQAHEAQNAALHRR